MAPAANATIAIAAAEAAASCHLVAVGRGARPRIQRREFVREEAAATAAASPEPARGPARGLLHGPDASVRAHSPPPPVLAHRVRSSKAPSSTRCRSECLHSCFTRPLQRRHRVAHHFALVRLRHRPSPRRPAGSASCDGLRSDHHGPNSRGGDGLGRRRDRARGCPQGVRGLHRGRTGRLRRSRGASSSLSSARLAAARRRC